MGDYMFCSDDTYESTLSMNTLYKVYMIELYQGHVMVTFEEDRSCGYNLKYFIKATDEEVLLYGK